MSTLCLARRSPRLAALTLLSLWVCSQSASCSDESSTPRTQLTLRVYASAEVSAAMSSLRVQAYPTLGPPQKDSTYLLDRAALTSWPVDIQVLPAHGNDSADSLELIAEALSPDGRTLVQRRALTSFVEHEKRVLELWLSACGQASLGQLCESNPTCHGASCLTCVQNMCVPTPFVPGAKLPVLDVSATPDPRALDPDRGTIMDSGATSSVELDAGPDASPLDAGPNTSQGPAVDAGTVTGGSLWCADTPYWQPVFAFGSIPDGAAPASQVIITATGDPDNPGPRDQYLCRARERDSSYVPGKVNGLSNGKFDYGCYFPHFDYDTGSWVALGLDQAGNTFDVLVPPKACTLSWAPASSSKSLPANILTVTRDKNFRPYYACRFDVQQPKSTGKHIGSVTSAQGDRCKIQFFGAVPLESETFEVLVSDVNVAPPQ